jgi:hypothetical protein
LTKHTPGLVSATVECDSQDLHATGAPEMITLLEADLAAAIRAELVEYFHAGVSPQPTLARYEFDRIVGGIMLRVADRAIATS